MSIRRSISLNFDYNAKLHRDGNNAGPSLTRSLGKFVGGNLRYFPDDDRHRSLEELPVGVADILDTRSGFVLFDGRRGHSVTDFIGERYSIVFFSIHQYSRVPLDQRHLLPDYPDEAKLNAIMRTLSPPKGYTDGGGLQQSIYAAFGMPDRRRALRWPSVSWSRLPAEVVVLLCAFDPVVRTLSKHFRCKVLQPK